MTEGIFRYSQDKVHYRDYPYEGTPIEGYNSSPTKEVLRIRFTEELPPGLPFMNGVSYCLKIITVCRSRSMLPANRDYWDAAGFPGSHLMHSIALDETGDRIASQLARTGQIDPRMAERKFMILEPDGTSLHNLIDRSRSADTGLISIRTFPILRRLDYLDQICEGLLELYSAPAAGGSRIVAYRDLKEENVVILSGTGDHPADLVQLIDFATIRLEDSEGSSTNSTYRSHFSESNTAPEDVIPPGDPVLPYYEVSGQDEKTDVFGLGMILGSLFTNCRPLRRWFRKYSMEQGGQDGLWQKAYESVISRYQFRDHHWLEAELSGILLWEPAVSLEVLGGLQRLFRQSSSLWPDRRPSVEAFRARLQELRTLAEEKEPASQASVPSADLSTRPARSESPDAYFTVLLINTSVPGTWLASYAAAARSFWESQRTALIESGVEDPLLYVGMIRYWDALMPDAACADLPRPLTVWPIDKFTDTILPAIQLKPAMSNSPEGLCQAMRHLQTYCEEKSPVFTGTVCFLTPDLPSASFLARSRFMELLDECSRMEIERSGQPLQAVAYTAVPDPSADWYDSCPLQGVPSSDRNRDGLPAGMAGNGFTPAGPVGAPLFRNTGFRSARDLSPAPSIGNGGETAEPASGLTAAAALPPEEAPVRAEDPLRLEDGFYVGAGALYWEDRDGQPVYVMQRRRNPL